MHIQETADKLLLGSVGETEGVTQIAAKREFIGLDWILANGKKYLIYSLITKDPTINVVTVNKETSIIRMLKQCVNL